MNLIQERNEIIHGLLFYWNCNVCRRLSWNKEHGCPENNADCGQFVYVKLKEHFAAMAEANKVATR